MCGVFLSQVLPFYDATAVDLFANGASSVFYDDISVSNLPFLDDFETGDTRRWHWTEDAP